METILQRTPECVYREDNLSCVAIVNKGYSPHMRYLPKHSRVSVSMLHEVLSASNRHLVAVGTNDQTADSLTKPLPAHKLAHHYKLLGLS